MKKLRTVVLLVGLFVTVLHLSSLAGDISMTEEMRKANIDWRRFSGEKISVNLSRIPHAESMLELIPEFEQLTGIDVDFQLLSDNEYWNKLTLDFASGAGNFDVVYTNNIMYNYIAAGYVEPLTAYLNDPKLTDLEWYDVDDFFELPWETCVWDGKTIGPNTYGIGDVYSIPFTSESTIMAYRKDIYAKYGMTLPNTWPELVDIAKKLTRDGVYGFMSRGSRKFSTLMFGGYSNGYFAYGASDFDKNLNAVFNSPEGVAFTELWADLVRGAAPPGYLSFTWEDARSSFMSGDRYAMTIEGDVFILSWENPELSEVVGKIGYALTPAGPAGHKNGQVSWSIGINSKSRHKNAAWLFIQWATSKPLLLRATAEFLTFPPTRRSVWLDPSVVEITGKWDNGNYRKVFTEMTEKKYTGILWTVSPEMIGLNEIWTEAVHKVILEQATAKKALDTLVERANEFMARYKK